MTGIRKVRVILGAVAIAVSVLASGALGLATANATAKPSPVLKVTPAVGLTNGRIVKVSGTGFKPHDQVYLVECLVKASGGGQCNTMGAVPVTITAKGLLPSTKFKVITGVIGNGKCGTKASNLKSCAISAGNASGGDSAVRPITFKAPKKK